MLGSTYALQSINSATINDLFESTIALATTASSQSSVRSPVSTRTDGSQTVLRALRDG